LALDLCPVRKAAHYTAITLPAEVDANNAGEVREELLRALNGGPAVLIVDMTGTSFFASAGIHALMRARARAGVAGIGLRAAVSAPVVRRVLKITGVDQLIDVYPSLDSALARLPVLDGNDGDRGRRQAADGEKAVAG
jgi:anti-anti-sigma factor